MKQVCILAFLLFSALYSGAVVDSVQYNSEYVFAEGVYLNFEQFQNQNPIGKERIISALDNNDPQFLTKVLQKPNLVIKRKDSDSTFSIKSNSVWGYSNAGIVYINHGKEFNRVMVIGMLCHFSAFVSTYGYQHDPYNLGTNSQPGYAQEQFMLDILIGKVMPFSPLAIEFVLQRDEELLKEWNALSKKKKKNSPFLFMRKYNQKHPLFFPK